MIKTYVAGKISKDSVFGTHDWRDNFCSELEKLSGLKIENLDPTKTGADQNDSMLVFGADKEYFGKIVKNYKDPFVFTTCDIVCETIEEVAGALKDVQSVQAKTLQIIPESIEYYLSKQKAS